MAVFGLVAVFSQIGVLESEEVEYAVDADGVDRLAGVGHHARLGMEGDAQSGLADHRQGVGTAAHGDGLCQVHFLHLCDEFEQFGLAVPVYHLAQVASGEFAVVIHLEFIGIHIVDAVAPLQVFAEVGESSAQDSYLVNKSGSRVTNKAKLKDNNDAYYVVNNNGKVLKYFPSEEDYKGWLTYDSENDKQISITTDMLKSATADKLQEAVDKAKADKKSK